MKTSSGVKHPYWFVFQKDGLITFERQGRIELPTFEMIADLVPKLLHQQTLGQFQDHSAYCGELPATDYLSPSLQAVPLKKALDLLGPDWYEITVKAYLLINWDRNHQYCGCCGNTTVYKPGTVERTCSICTLAFYPRISPSIIVLIYKNDSILMARSPHFAPGVYGLIAGFVEVGESLEMAVHREVKEEVNIQIKDLRYFGSQAWPFPDSLMLAFTAEYAGGDIIKDPREIETADWYPIDNLPGRPSNTISMSSKLIEHFIRQHLKIKKETNSGNNA
jgi:NAD+ diphosphatase